MQTLSPAEETQMLLSVFARSRLFIDLDEALDPESPESTLVVLGFEPCDDHFERGADPDAETLLQRATLEVTRRVTGHGTIYRPRRAELCLLLDGSPTELRPLLADVQAEIARIARSHGRRTTFGVVSLPGEASDPVSAVALADRQRRVDDGELTSDDRRSELVARPHL